MEKSERQGTIAWIFSRPEGKQFLAACLVVIGILGATIVWQEARYDKSEADHKKELKECKQETIDILKSANNDAQKMRDSLYTMGMKQKEIEQKINKK